MTIMENPPSFFDEYYTQLIDFFCNILEKEVENDIEVLIMKIFFNYSIHLKTDEQFENFIEKMTKIIDKLKIFVSNKKEELLEDILYNVIDSHDMGFNPNSIRI